MNNFVKKYHFEIIILCVALFVRLALFCFNLNVNQGNLISTIKADDGYYELSQNIINGHGFSFDDRYPYRPNSLRPPLWPYLIAFLASLGGYWTVAFVEIIMASLIPVFGFKIAKYLIGDKAKWVGWLMVFEPYSVLLSFLLYSETSFNFFFIISLYLFTKYFGKSEIYYLVWSAVFLGLAILIKPTVQYFPILIPIFLIIAFRQSNPKRKITEAFAYAFIVIVIICPWLYRNYHYFGKIDMTVQPVFNLYVYLVPTVLSIDNHTNFAIELNNFIDKRGVSVLDINLANADRYKKEAVPIILDHKIALIKSVFITIITFFTHDGMLTILQYSGIKISNSVNVPFIQLVFSPIRLLKVIYEYLFSPAILIIVGRLVWFIITISFVYGIYRYIKKEKKKIEAILFGLMVSYFALTTSINGLGVNARFRIPILVIIFCFAVYGIYDILSFVYKYYRNKKA